MRYPKATIFKTLLLRLSLVISLFVFPGNETSAEATRQRVQTELTITQEAKDKRYVSYKSIWNKALLADYYSCTNDLFTIDRYSHLTAVKLEQYKKTVASFTPLRLLVLPGCTKDQEHIA